MVSDDDGGEGGNFKIQYDYFVAGETYYLQYWYYGNSKTGSFTVNSYKDYYTVSYDANGGTGAPASQTKSYDIDLTLSSIEPTRTGYIFEGWSTSSTGSVVYNPGETYTTNSEITLYACWVLCGDVYNDGKVDIQDMESLAAFLSNKQVSIHTLASDINADGKITLHDLRSLFKMLASGE